MYFCFDFWERSPRFYGSSHTIPVSVRRFHMCYYYTESVQCQDTVNIAYYINLYKILMIKIIKITDVTTSITILPDIVYFNNIVVIQFTVYSIQWQWVQCNIGQDNMSMKECCVIQYMYV